MVKYIYSSSVKSRLDVLYDLPPLPSFIFLRLRQKVSWRQRRKRQLWKL